MTADLFTVWSRSDWNAAPPQGHLNPMPKPVSKLFVHHSVTNVWGDNARTMQEIQRAGFNRGFADVSYPGVILPGRTFAQGRGYDVVGAHTVDHQGHSLNTVGTAICFAGCFHPGAGLPERYLTDDDVLTFRFAVAFLKATGYITGDCELIPHRSTYATGCPGDHVVERWADLVVPYTDGHAITTPAPPQPPSTVGPHVPRPQPTLTSSGKSSSGAKTLQAALNVAIGSPLAVDGIYGPRTVAAVEALQRFAAIAIDGIYGPNTAGALDRLLTAKGR